MEATPVVHYLRSDCPHLPGLLRISIVAHRLESAKEVRPYTPLFIKSREIVDGFICVRVSNDEDTPPYWVRPQHILARCSDEWRTTFIDDDTWNSMHFTIELSQLQIRVSEGVKADIAPSEVAAYEAAIPFNVRSLYEHYTYVSLEIGHPESGEYVSGRKCHITIGYLPALCARRNASVEGAFARRSRAMAFYDT